MWCAGVSIGNAVIGPAIPNARSQAQARYGRRRTRESYPLAPRQARREPGGPARLSLHSDCNNFPRAMALGRLSSRSRWPPGARRARPCRDRRGAAGADRAAVTCGRARRAWPSARACRCARCSSTSTTSIRSSRLPRPGRQSGWRRWPAPRLPRGRSTRRLDAFVRARARLLEAISPVRRAALLMEPFSSELQRRLGAFRVLKAGEVRRVFATELDAARSPPPGGASGGARRRRASWNRWQALRQHQGLSQAEARRVLRVMLEQRAPERLDRGHEGRRHDGRLSHLRRRSCPRTR